MTAGRKDGEDGASRCPSRWFLRLPRLRRDHRSGPRAIWVRGKGAPTFSAFLKLTHYGRLRPESGPRRASGDQGEGVRAPLRQEGGPS
jgi:hypothetical protein